MAKARWVFGGLLATLVVGSAGDASACGGCFAPPQVVSTVTGHRMAYAVSDERSVLWDQFEYQGSPEEFGWVLPVAPGAYVEVASQGFFDALEQSTVTEVTPPPLICAQSDSSSGCGLSAQGEDSGSALTSADGYWGGDSVQVVFHGNVGPYETVTLSSEDPAALTDWLNAHGYVIPDDIHPVIEQYVDEGADFIALRLRPNVGIQQMQPVRVVTPQGAPILPLRMVAAGVGEEVDIVLYVIGEGRFTIPDFSDVEVDLDRVSYDYAAFTSNYWTLRERALAENEGRSVLTSFAQRGLLTEFSDGFVATRDVRGTDLQNFLRTYGALADAAQRAAEQGGGEVQVFPGTGDGCVQGQDFAEDVVVEDPCYGQSEIAAPVDCLAERGNGLSALFACGEHTDVAAALVGQVPKRAWVTRLELRLPKAALDADCAVERVQAEPLGNVIQARKTKNPPCEPALFTASVARRGRGALGSGLLAFLFVAFWLRRPRRR
jgi:hypothetical protein